MDGLDLKLAGTSTTPGSYRGLPPKRSMLRRLAGKVPFILVVIAPTVIAGVYLFGFASYQYVSEAKFVVRGPATQSPGMFSNLLQTAGVSRAQDDTYAVQDYIASRDALSQMIEQQDIRAVFDRPEADTLSRFPTFWRGDSLEHLYKYYQNHVEVTLDTTTGVTSLMVRTFRPDDSQRITTALLSAAEGLVNRMNDRQRENAMRDAKKEVTLAEERLQGIAGQIAGFRNREAILDPNKQSVPMLAAITDLQAALTKVNLQISQLTVSSPRSPLISEYQRRGIALQQQIDQAKVKITGNDSSMVPKMMAFDMLTLQRELADKQLVSATTSLETARVQAERQQLYLDLIVQPNMADYAAYPKRFASLAIVFASALGIYLLGTLMISAAREHKIV
ncbi:MAG: hypothetical protein ACRYGM_11665 [Janthinobacterium lividum]|jgi:capsular polysaccharide transport system permease protein